MKTLTILWRVYLLGMFFRLRITTTTSCQDQEQTCNQCFHGFLTKPLREGYGMRANPVCPYSARSRSMSETADICMVLHGFIQFALR